MSLVGKGGGCLEKNTGDKEFNSKYFPKKGNQGTQPTETLTDHSQHFNSATELLRIPRGTGRRAWILTITSRTAWASPFC